MVYKPRTTSEIYGSLKTRLTGKVDKLTQFVPTSFNYIWTHDGFATFFHRFEIALLAAQLAGYPDYSGGPITNSDLRALGITDITAAEINQFMDDQDLDELAKIVGISRDPGEKAAGDVTFTTATDAVAIPKGTEVSTEPDADGDYKSYLTTKEVVPADGSTKVTAPVRAADVGIKYNTGASTVTYLPTPPTGVEGVTNQMEIDGGEDQETNEELRERLKGAVSENSGGGTVKGIEGFVENAVGDVESVEVEEFPTATPPYADVIVDGGVTSDVTDAIADSHPAGVKHNLVRPTIYQVAVTATVTGSNIDTNSSENLVESYLDDMELGEDVYRSRITQQIMNGDEDIENVESLTVEIYEEPHTYQSGTTQYSLDKSGQLPSDGITDVFDETGTSYSEGTDYDEADTDADGVIDGIDWGIGGSNPSGGTEFYVTYTQNTDIPIGPREKAGIGPISVTVA